MRERTEARREVGQASQVSCSSSSLLLGVCVLKSDPASWLPGVPLPLPSGAGTGTWRSTSLFVCFCTVPGHLLPLSKALIISSPLGTGHRGYGGRQAKYPSSYHVAAFLSQSLILSLEDPSLAHQDVLPRGRCRPSFQPKQWRA